jgi:hypothetical protein
MPGWAIDLFGCYINPNREDYKSLLEKFKIHLYECKILIEDETTFEQELQRWMYELDIEEDNYESDSSIKIITPEHCSKKVLTKLS